MKDIFTQPAETNKLIRRIMAGKFVKNVFLFFQYAAIITETVWKNIVSLKSYYH